MLAKPYPPANQALLSVSAHMDALIDSGTWSKHGVKRIG